MSPQTQVRSVIGLLAITLFVIAGLSVDPQSGDMTVSVLSQGLRWVSFGLAAVSAMLLVPPSPRK